MAAAWEVWTLWWLAAFQLAVAVWWWKGPRLEGTKFWVPGLFVLNGVAMVLRTTARTTEWGEFHGAAAVFGRWTNLFLLAIPLAALDPDSDRNYLRYGILAVFALGLAVATPDVYLSKLSNYMPWTYVTPSWFSILVEPALWLGAALTVPALTYRLVYEDGRTQVAWGVALGVLALRFGEFVLYYGPSSVETVLAGSVTVLDGGPDILRAGTVVAMLVSFVALLGVRLRRKDPEPIFDLAILMVLGGFLFGAGRPRGGHFALVSVFTLATIRPAGFLAAQFHLEEQGLLDSIKGRRVAAGIGIFGVSLAGILLARMWDTGVLKTLLIASSFVLVSLPAARWIGGRLPTPEPGPAKARTAVATGDAGDLPVDPDKVTLPDDWQGQLQTARTAYRDLNPDPRTGLDDLVRWQRILLALHGAPEDGNLPAYERTTPGLHLATHAPYPEIGPEISRANDRWEAILSEYGVSRPDALPDPDEPLIESTWGRAEDLDSPRVKIYELTEFGERVAQRIIEEVGLDGTDPDEVRMLVGEGLRETR